MKIVKKINVLVTGAGAPGIAGTIFSLRNNPDKRKFKIISVDINRDVVGRFFSDGFYKVPVPEDKNYIPELLKIIKKEKVEVIVPQTTREIIFLSKNLSVFKEKGVAVVVSPYASILKANNKYLLLKRAAQIGLPHPKYFITNSKDSLEAAFSKLNYPKKNVVVKPCISNGMRGVRIVTKTGSWNVEKFLREKPEGLEISSEDLTKILDKGNWPELMAMEYLPGKEYSVDVFRNSRGTIAIPRLREKIRSGITFDAKVELREDIIEYSKKLADSLNLFYCFGFQFKLSENNIPMVIESNPRVQGTMIAASFAGLNMIYYSVEEALGETVKLEKLKIENGIKFKRYWGGVGISKNGRFIAKI